MIRKSGQERTARIKWVRRRKREESKENRREKGKSGRIEDSERRDKEISR